MTFEADLLNDGCLGISTLYVWLVTSPLAVEGMAMWPMHKTTLSDGHPVLTPLMSGDEVRARELRDLAATVARKQGRECSLVRFNRDSTLLVVGG